MRTILLALAVFVSSASPAWPGQEARPDADSYEEALRAAGERGVGVYLVFKGENCPWCERQKEVLYSRAARRHMEDVVLCVLDVQDERDLAAAHGVTSVPAHRLLGPGGEPRKSHTGFMSEREIRRFLSR